MGPAVTNQQPVRYRESESYNYRRGEPNPVSGISVVGWTYFPPLRELLDPGNTYAQDGWCWPRKMLSLILVELLLFVASLALVNNGTPGKISRKKIWKFIKKNSFWNFWKNFQNNHESFYWRISGRIPKEISWKILRKNLGKMQWVLVSILKKKFWNIDHENS